MNKISLKRICGSLLTVLAIMLFFTVSLGGCGGGSSSHFSGNYALEPDNGDNDDVSPEPNSPTSQDVNPVPDNPASDDVTPTPENPTSGDEYGDDEYGNGDDFEEVNNFTMLNNTEWTFIANNRFGVADNAVTVYKTRANGDFYVSMQLLPDTYNYYPLFKLSIQSGNNMLFWIDSNGVYRFDAFTVDFVDTDTNETLKAPLLRSGSNFSYNNRRWEAAVEGNGNESIIITSKNGIPSHLTIRNYFYINGAEYFSEINLMRVN